MTKDSWHKINKNVLAKNIIALNQVNELMKHFENFCLMRGMALIVSKVYKLGERDMEDIDICVDLEDKERFFSVMRELKYSFVPSGEYCFRRREWELPIDVHFENVKEIRRVRFFGRGFNVLSKKLLFLDLIKHSYFQHYER
ncbi:MAG: hypothetical protein DRI36_01620, partial [Caldiserica bacterium]